MLSEHDLVDFIRREVKAAINDAVPMNDERQVRLAFDIAKHHAEVLPNSLVAIGASAEEPQTGWPTDILGGAHAILRKALGVPEPPTRS